MEIPKTRPGPKSKWTINTLEQVYRLALLGATDNQVADFFDVTVKTIEVWKRNRPKFLKALKKGKLEADSNVAKSLYHRAIGYSHPDVHIMSNRVKIYDENGNVIEERTEALLVPIIKHYPPDTSAAIKWLSMRQREQWAEITRFEGTINYNVQGEIKHISEQITDLKSFTTEDLKLALKFGLMENNKKALINKTTHN